MALIESDLMILFQNQPNCILQQNHKYALPASIWHVLA